MKLISLLLGASALAACSGSDLGGATSASNDKESTKPAQRPGSDSEIETDENERIIDPTLVSGAFLVCGDNNEGGDGNYGCAVYAKDTESRLSCQQYNGAQVTYSDDRVVNLATKPSLQGSYWHFLMNKDAGSDVTTLKAQAVCGGNNHVAVATEFHYAPLPRILLFVSTQDFNGALGSGSSSDAGILGADQKCQDDIGNPNAKALLSLRDEKNARERLRNGKKIINSEGDELANHAEELWKSGPKASILNRSGQPLSGSAQVWTGSDEHGMFKSHSKFDTYPGTFIPTASISGGCWFWKDKIDPLTGTEAFGWTASPALGSSWFAPGNDPLDCSQNAYLYCFIEF